MSIDTVLEMLSVTCAIAVDRHDLTKHLAFLVVFRGDMDTYFVMYR